MTLVKQRVRSKRAKGRPRGETHHNAKYTDHEVELVRQLRDLGWIYRRISEKMDMPIRTVRDIVNYKKRT